jgi:hypothetical protein
VKDGFAMPHTTHAYGFEAKVCWFASQMSERFIAGENLCSFLLTLDREGNTLSLSFADGSAEWRARAWAIVDSEGPYLFFDPLDDGKEYIWLSWKLIARGVMERLIGQPFADSDFHPLPAFARRAHPLNPEEPFPESWGVMF